MADKYDLLAQCADELRRDGVSVLAGLFEDSLLLALRDDSAALATAGKLRPAVTGRELERKLGVLRGDDTLWLDDPACGAAPRDFLVALGALRVALNHRLMLGMETIEAHYAIFPPGASYVRHRDRFRNEDARVLSLVCYLNPDWPDDAGGALRLHLPRGPIDVSPRLGTTVLFLSDEIEHEVLPATQPRMSIAAWFLRSERL
jgi:SM-20-related protein